MTLTVKLGNGVTIFFILGFSIQLVNPLRKLFHDTAISAWEDLKERFAKVDLVRISSLISTINNLKEGTKTEVEYFIELGTLWDELNSHRPIPNCTCVHPCRCDSTRLAKLYISEDQIIQFLTGLNESFFVVKTQILLMDPLPSINKVYSLVVQEEIQNAGVSNLVTIDESSISVNASDARKFYPRTKVLLVILMDRMVQGFAPFVTGIITVLSFTIRSMDILISTRQVHLLIMLVLKLLM